MLDNFITCSSFFKRTKDCKVIKFGVHSDHAAIKVKFRLTAMKFSNDLDDITIIDWKKIQTENAEKAIFNDKLEELTSLERDYTTFNANILQAGLETATRKKTENKGWFHHSEQTLISIISHRDYLLHHLQTCNHDDTLLKIQLILSQEAVTSNIALAKSAWSLHQAAKIHEM